MGTASIGMFGDRDINAAPIGGAVRPAVLTRRLAGRRIGTTMWDSYLNANYHSLQVAINRSFSKGLSLKGAYTYSKAINMTDDDGWASVTGTPRLGVQPGNVHAPVTTVARCSRWASSPELPVGQNMTGAGKAILGGWQVSGIMALLTGTPFTVGASGRSSTLRATPRRPTRLVR
ncbi:MAG: hypothetical protein R2748_07825 [Bryobacterales bacterium]